MTAWSRTWPGCGLDWGWEQGGAMARPLACYGHDNDDAVFVLHRVGHARPCAHHSMGIWGGEVWVWVGVGGSPVGVRTTATTASLPFSYADKGGGHGGIL